MARQQAEKPATKAPVRRRRTTTKARRTTVVVVPRLVEDDTEVLAAEHAACDAQLLQVLERLCA